MRKTWLVIPVVLLGVAPLAAQQAGAPGRTVSLWASQPGETPQPQNRTAATGPAFILMHANAAPPPTAPQPANGGQAPAAVLAVPVVAQPQPAPQPHPQPQPGCAGGHCGERQPLDCEHLRAWLCYHSIRGCCNKKGGCGCSCYIPLYLYFWGECKEGRKYELPPCAHEHEPPHLFHSMFNHACSGLGSRGTAAPCATTTAPVTYTTTYQPANPGR